MTEEWAIWPQRCSSRIVSATLSSASKEGGHSLQTVTRGTFSFSAALAAAPISFPAASKKRAALGLSLSMNLDKLSVTPNEMRAPLSIALATSKLWAFNL